MTSTLAPVPQEARVTEGKVRVFAADGGFLRKIKRTVADELLAAGLVEWRGQNLRMIDVPSRSCGLDGLHVVREARTEGNMRGAFAFRSVNGIGPERVAK